MARANAPDDVEVLIAASRKEKVEDRIAVAQAAGLKPVVVDEGVTDLDKLDLAQRQMSDAGKPAGDDYLLKVDHPLVVPVDRKIRIITTAVDVIHSWGVPSFAVKQDAIPGFIRDTWFKATETGTFRGQCAELCGKNHGFMPIVVKVVTQQEYTAWVAQQKKPQASAGAALQTADANASK